MFRIYCHDDFDGLAAAGVFTAFFRWKCDSKAPIYYEFVDYDNVEKFRAQPLKKTSAVLDFVFHPQATWWFDHHTTSFFQLGDRKLYRPSAYMRWDPKALSCPSLLMSLFKRHYTEFHGAYKERFSELAEQADIIDSALYDSPRQAYDFTNPYVALSLIFGETSNRSIRESFIRAVASGRLSEFFQSERFRREKTRAQHGFGNLAQDILECTEQHGNVLLVDCRSLCKAPYRYLPYLLHPSADFTITVSRRGGKIHIGVGFNPWKTGNRLNLGNLMKQYGGGGRENVAAVLVGDDATATQIVEALKAQLSPVSCGQVMQRGFETTKRAASS